MTKSKLTREFLRLLLQLTSKCPFMFTDSFCRSIKEKWNYLQFQEGRNIQYVCPIDRPGIVHVNLVCTSGGGEAVHPSVLYLPDGFGAGRWKYLMSVTPFPMGITYFENPEFVVSSDGILWTLPDNKAFSPVVSAPSDWTGYNSDPNLYYDNTLEKLFLFYREVREDRNRLTVTIFVKSTVDGISWSQPISVAVCETPKTIGTVLLSPSVLKVGANIYAWYVEKQYDRYCLKRAECSGFSTLTEVVVCKVIGMPDNFSLWHIEVKNDNDRLVMAACVTDELTKIRSIIFAESFDAGLRWNVLPRKLAPERMSREKSLYKASLIKTELGGAQWRLFYSYNDVEGHWFIAVRDIVL